MKASVVIPTYRRPDQLRQCVQSILNGTRKPEEIIVVGRKGDATTMDVVAQLRSDAAHGGRIRDAWVDRPGHLPPVETGIHLATGDVVATVDDDVTVTASWLDRLLANFADPKVGVVGGRVVVPGQSPPRLRGRPGQVSWYGKHWGNIAAVDGEVPFPVAAVMEGNWAWRRALVAGLQFDPYLNFDDASMYGLEWCCQARAKGFQVIYDSSAVVHHHVAPRIPELERSNRPRRLLSYCRNYTYIMLKHLPAWRKPVFLLWWFVVGERGAWGLGALVAETLMHGFHWWPELRPAWRGKIEGIRLWLGATPTVK